MAVEGELLVTTLNNNTLSHCQIKTTVAFSPWKKKSSSNLANTMYNYVHCTVDNNASRNEFSLKAVFRLKYCKKYFCKLHTFL